MTPQSLQLLERLLTGFHLSSADLDNLVTNAIREDLHLEYKHGNELLNKDANDTIRDYMSGFANSAGGVLIIGIEDSHGNPSRITGCHGHKKGKLDEWAARCLNPIANYFSPLPRFHVVSHPNGDVLVGMAQRSLGLVPRSEAGGIVYHFRLHDQTLKAPDFLMADLLLGRRQQPMLDVLDCKAVNLRRVFDNAAGAMDLELELRFQLENMSIVWAEECRWGIIAWVQQNNSLGHKVDISNPSNHLLSFVETRDIKPERYRRPCQLLHFRGITHIDKPFESDHRTINFSIPLRVHDRWFTYTWKAALYLIAKNSLPIWYQISIMVNTDTVKLIDEKTPLTSTSGNIVITKMSTDRPVVDWENI